MSGQSETFLRCCDRRRIRSSPRCSTSTPCPIPGPAGRKPGRLRSPKRPASWKRPSKKTFPVSLEHRSTEADSAPTSRCTSSRRCFSRSPLRSVRSCGRLSLKKKSKPFETSFRNPEEINDNSETAPSKRLLKVFANYRKLFHGLIAAKRIGIDAMRKECPHFAQWVEVLESLGQQRVRKQRRKCKGERANGHRFL